MNEDPMNEGREYREYLVDEFECCDNCGYIIRPGWTVNADTAHGVICGKCCNELELVPSARAIYYDT